MTKIKFFTDKAALKGFSVSGHSSVDCEDTEGRIVCAAVSSAVYMTANTLTDVIREKCEIEESDALFSLLVNSEKSETQAVLKGLKLHFEGLEEQYPKRIKIITEV